MARTDSEQHKPTPDPPRHNAKAPRPYISIYFECCGVYARIYRQPEKMVYYGHCPRCLRTVTVRVGPEGTRARLFRAR
jgi:hypothetical protein